MTAIGKMPVGAGLFVEGRAALPDAIRSDNALAVPAAFSEKAG